MKKTLSILLTVIMIVTTISVLAIIPAVADPTTPVNLIVNGDGEDGNWTATTYAASKLSTVHNIAMDRGDEYYDAYGWYSTNDWGNARAFKLVDKAAGITFENYSGEYIIYSGAWQTGYQDIEIEANKTYRLSAKITTVPTDTAVTNANNNFNLKVEPSFGTRTQASVSGKDWNYSFGHADKEAIANAHFASDILHTGTGKYWDGDFVDYAIIFDSNDFISENNLTQNSNDKYDCRVAIQNNSPNPIMYDDVSLYEVCEIKKTDGGYTNIDHVKVGEQATITATPYYGNAFLGWYDDNNTLVSNEQSITDYFTKNLTAKFNVYNQVIDGDFESPNGEGIAAVNAPPNYSSKINATAVAPGGTTASKHGNYCAELNITASTANQWATAIPVTIEKNKDYFFTYSVYTLDSNSTEPVIFSTFLTPNLGQTWGTVNVRADFGDTSTLNFYNERTGILANLYSWVGEVGAGTGSYTINMNMLTAGDWTVVRYMFNSGNSTTIFGNNDTATIYMNIGLPNTAGYDIQLDNIFFGEVSNSIFGCKADNGGYLSADDVITPPYPMYYKTSANGTDFNASDKDKSYYPLIANKAQNVTAKAYYGNTFLGWYEGNTKISDNATIKDDGTKSYIAKFTNTNQIPDGDFEAGTGVATWQSTVSGTAFSFAEGTGVSGKGMVGSSTSDSIMAAKMPVTVKKSTDYVVQFNMKVDSFAEKAGTPVWALTFTNNPSNSWNEVPTVARYELTLVSSTDKSKQYNSVLNNQPANKAPQVKFEQLNEIFGTDWIEVTLKVNFGDENTNAFFTDKNEETVYLTLGYNKATASATYDNMSFYEDLDLVSFSHKENVRPYRVGIGPVADGNEYKFGVDTGAASVTVKHNGTTVNATDGVYTITLADTNDIVITADNDSEYPEMGKDLNGNSLKEYNHELYTTPKIWEGDTVYHENAVFYKERNEIKLLYPISDIISVRSFDLQTYYVEGVDFEVTAEGALKILPGSKIPVYAHTPTNTEIVWNDSDTEGTYITQYSGGSVYPCTLSITYKHTEKWADGYQGAKQTSVEDQLFDLFQKLRNGEDVHVVFYGDSMTSGWSASGGKTNVYTAANDGTFEPSGLSYAPYMPNWMTMFIDGLKKIYPDANITWENLSLGGKNSDWGATNFDARYELLSNKDIDLFLIGFGINDCGGKVTKDAFKANTESIISKLRAKCSDAAVLLYGGNSTNTDAKMYDKDTLISYEQALVEIAAATENTAATSFTSIYFDVAKSKESSDLFENNLNHANDFGCRIYAQTMLGAFAKKYTSTAATPAAPDENAAVVAKRSVTLPAIAGNEYSMDGINWQDSPLFTGLEPDTTYTFYQRVKRTDTVFESACSPVANIKTLEIIYTLGDVNNDGVIDSDDAVLILQKEADLLSTDFTEEQTLAADVDKDGDIDSNDAQKVLNYTVGVTDAFAN